MKQPLYNTPVLKLDRVPHWNAAGIHPRLADSSEEYFGACAFVRREIKTRLRNCLRCSHELILCPNTTTAVIEMLGFVLMQKASKIFVHRPFYPKFEPLFTQCLHRDFLTECRETAQVLFVTHVDPITGEIYELPTPAPAQLLLIDAAQSLGSAIQDELNSRSTIFIGPCHKHLGLTPGLGIIGIEWGRVPVQFHEALHHYLALVEHGTMDLVMLRRVHAALQSTTQPRVNQMRLHIGERLCNAVRQMGAEVITPRGPQLHIFAIRGKNESIPNIFDLQTLGGKYFPEYDVLRFSLHSTEWPLHAETYEDAILSELRRACV